MTDTYTRSAEAVLERAEAEARGLHHPYVGTEHLLLALTVAGGPELTQLLARYNIDRTRTLDGLEQLIGRGIAPGSAPGVELVPTPRHSAVRNNARQTALAAGRDRVAPQDLMLALFEEGRGAGMQILQRFGDVGFLGLGADLRRLVSAARPAEPEPAPAEAATAHRTTAAAGEPVLVVDFGTAASSAALVAPDGGVRLIKEPASGLYSWPSAVCRDGDALLVGSAANGRKRAMPTAYRAEFKRDLGEDAPIPLGDRAYPAPELVAALLRAFAEQGRELAGGPLHRLVLTVPASYRPEDPRTAAMLAAGEAAGFAEVELVPEPVAAGRAPLVGAGFGPGDLALVYDFGGGTFDAALVRHNADGRHEVLGHAALDDCGGRDVDALIVAHLRDTGGDELAAALAPPALTGDAALRARLHLADFVRGLKHHLSATEQVEDYASPAAPPVVLRRDELAGLVAPLLARTVECCRDLMRRCGVGPADVTAVLLVGGTTRMPAVADAVARDLGRPLRRPEDPDLAVVQGAAALARLSGPRTVPATLPTPDRTPLTWEVPGGSATLLRWLVEPGGQYTGGDHLAVVRGGDGALWRLEAPPPGGIVTGHHVPPGTRFASGDWLTTVTVLVEDAVLDRRLNRLDVDSLSDTDLEALILEVRRVKEAAIDDRRFDRAGELRDTEKRLLAESTARALRR